MRTSWLQQRNTAALICVFGGWALGRQPFRHLAGEEDVLFVDDYRSFTPLPALARYERVDLLAFSFGVCSAAHWTVAHGDPFRARIAINGTPWACDDRFGVPEAAARGTAEGLSDATLAKFARRCGVRPSAPDQKVATLRAELEAIMDRGACHALRFDHAWQMEQDRILPAANAARAWAEAGTPCTTTGGAHGDLTRWTQWRELWP